MSRHADRRALIIGNAMSRLRELKLNNDSERHHLKNVENILLDLAKEKSVFDESDFPNPPSGTYDSVYLLAEETDATHALYLVCARQGKVVAPHNHTSWAVIAGLEGEEKNYIYEQTGDPDMPDGLGISEIYQVCIGEGQALSLMPDDFHGIEAKTPMIRHLHWYGKSLPEQKERLTFLDGSWQKKESPALAIDTSRRIY